LEGRGELFLHLSPGSGERWRTSIVAGIHFVLPHDVLGVVPFAVGNEHGTKHPDVGGRMAS
jgi:hypothetical protein